LLHTDASTDLTYTHTQEGKDCQKVFVTFALQSLAKHGEVWHDVKRYAKLLPTLGWPRMQNPALFGAAWIPAARKARNLLVFHTHPPVSFPSLMGGGGNSDPHISSLECMGGISSLICGCWWKFTSS